MATELFELNGKHFPIAIDFFSRIIELIELRSETPVCVITTLKIIFARFESNGKHFLIAINFFSRFIELIELRSETPDCVTTTLKSIFARHGIPAVECKDIGPCYAAEKFQQLTTTYAFLHTASNPRYAQDNGQAERGGTNR